MKENAMNDLRQLVGACPSGQKLISALESSNLSHGDIPGLVAAVIKESRAAGAVGAAPAAGVDARSDLSAALSVVPSLNFVNPRGKQDLALFADHLVVRTGKADVSVPYSAIQHIAILDEIPKDKKGRVLLYLHLGGQGVPHGKGHLSALVINTTADTQLDIRHPQDASSRLAGTAAVVLCQAFGAMGVAPTCFCSPDPEVFLSTSGAAGVEANVKARPGYLFPMPAGLCFLEVPAMFIPMRNIKSVELARANGTSSTFDIHVHTRDGKTVEFSTIARDEAGRIQAYLSVMRLPLGPPPDSDSDAEGGSSSEGGADSDSDDPEDEDFNPYGSSDGDEQELKKKHTQSKASGDGATTASRSVGSGSSSGSEDDSDDDASSGSDAEEEEEAGAAPGGAEEADAAASEDVGSSDSEDEEEEEESEDDSDSEDDGSVELVDEEDMSVGQLQSAIQQSEAEAGLPPSKKARQG